MVSLSSTAFAAEKQDIVYTALGDSIANGTRGKKGIGYTDLFCDQLDRIYGEVTFNDDLAADGMTSGDLLCALEQSPVYGSDVITVSIGGNDFLGPFVSQLFPLYEAYDGDIDALNTALQLACNDPEHADPVLVGALHELSTELAASLSGFAEYFVQIMGLIHGYSPDADIYVNTVYNPFYWSPVLHAFADPYIQTMNEIIFGYSVIGYKVVDVYSAFEEYANPKKPVVGDLSNLSDLLVFLSNPENDIADFKGTIPLHPTDVGYKFIANLHKDLLGVPVVPAG